MGSRPSRDHDRDRDAPAEDVSGFSVGDRVRLRVGLTNLRREPTTTITMFEDSIGIIISFATESTNRYAVCRFRRNSRDVWLCVDPAPEIRMADEEDNHSAIDIDHISATKAAPRIRPLISAACVWRRPRRRS